MDEADHCGDLLLLREGHLLAHTTPTQLREDTGCTSLEEAFLSVIRHSTAAPSRLSPHAYIATTGRILRQLAADHRSVAMILVVPSLIITLMYFMFQNAPHRPGTPSPFNTACLIMLGRVPALRDVPDHVDHDAARTGFGNVGAHPHHSAAPARPARRLRHRVLDRSGCAGHAGVRGVVLAARVRHGGQPDLVFVIAIVNAVLGVGLGLLCSAFARTEFQAVQFMPVVIVPQLLLSGIIVPRAALPEWLQWISNVLPASYALEALQQVGAHPEPDRHRACATSSSSIGFAVVALALAAATLRRRTP